MRLLSDKDTKHKGKRRPKILKKSKSKDQKKQNTTNSTYIKHYVEIKTITLNLSVASYMWKIFRNSYWPNKTYLTEFFFVHADFIPITPNINTNHYDIKCWYQILTTLNAAQNCEK